MGFVTLSTIEISDLVKVKNERRKKASWSGFDKIEGGVRAQARLRPADYKLANLRLTLILRLRQVKQPVFVRRLTSFLCLLPDSILLGSPGS